jgi:hypothetical protein
MPIESKKCGACNEEANCTNKQSEYFKSTCVVAANMYESAVCHLYSGKGEING